MTDPNHESRTTSDAPEPLTDAEMQELANSPIWEHERLVGTGNQVKSLADEVGRLRAEREPIGDEEINDLEDGLNDSLVLRSKAAAEIRRLRKVLESIRKQAQCNTETAPEGAAYRCWHKEYGRHAPDCQWEIAREADDALKGADDE